MSERPPYSRIYWSVLDDPKFDAVRDDMRNFGAWALLLVLADMAWPAPAFLPPTVSRRSITVLEQAGLIDKLAGWRYRIHGLDKEREQRSNHAASAAAARWSNAPSNAPSSPPSNAETMPRQAETRRDETSTDTARASESDPVVVYATLTNGWPSPKAVDWIDSLTGEYGAGQTCAALAEAAKEGRSGVIGRAKVILGTKARALSQAEKKRESSRIYDRMVARRLEEYRVTGIWHAEWGERPEAA